MTAEEAKRGARAVPGTDLGPRTRKRPSEQAAAPELSRDGSSAARPNAGRRGARASLSWSIPGAHPGAGTHPAMMPRTVRKTSSKARLTGSERS
jgi:hypothetical protein